VKLLEVTRRHQEKENERKSCAVSGFNVADGSTRPVCVCVCPPPVDNGLGEDSEGHALADSVAVALAMQDMKSETIARAFECKTANMRKSVKAEGGIFKTPHFRDQT
jgi:hypothetical protein